MTKEEINQRDLRLNKIRESNKLDSEIMKLRFMLDILTEKTCRPATSKYQIVKFRKRTIFSLWGRFENSRVEEIEIPEYMVIEIAAKCDLWIKELEGRANALLSLP